MSQHLWFTQRGKKTAHLWYKSETTGEFYQVCMTSFDGSPRGDLREPYVSEPECKRCKRRELAK